MKSIPALTASDYTKRSTVTVNGRAVTSLTVSFERGFRAALAGLNINTCTYSKPEMVEAFNRGHARASDLKRKGGK